jgi:hypothetical protein
MPSKRSRNHDRELTRLLSFVGIFSLLSVSSYLVPGLELVRPWVPGEPVPLVHLALDRAIITENAQGELVRQEKDFQPGTDALSSLDSGDPPAVADLDEALPADTVDLPPVGESIVADAVGVDETASGLGIEPEADAPESRTDVSLPEGSDDAPTEDAAEQDAAETPSDADGSQTPPAETEPSDEAPQVATLTPAQGPPNTAASVIVTIPEQAPLEQASIPDDVARPGNGNLRDRLPALGTPLEVPPGSLDAWFTSLAKAAAGVPDHIARALHWGDSTIAGDGITRTMRSRLQGRFGDGGPGFLAVQVDPRWASRPGVLRHAKGAWKTRTITFGGAGNKYYGLGGTVSTAYGKSSSTLGGSKVGDQRQALHRFDIAFQTRPGGGTLVVQVEGGEGATFQTSSESTFDAFHTLTAPSGAQKLHVATNGDGPVTIYGVSLETRGPGMTWETLGVAGAGQGSMFRQGPNHLARQVAWRNPDLVVYQMGGNELGYPSLKTGGGKVWKERYVRVVRSLRAGAPEASCLLITPLDQGERVRGTVRSKPTMATMVRLQRETAREMGCAFWDAQAAMGGSGSFGVWLNKKLAWSDLYHLTNKGLALIGHTLADAMEAAYDEWRRGTAGVGESSRGGPSNG